MKHNANLNVKGVVIGSSASISSMNAIQAISVAGSSVSRGTVVLSNSNNVSFGLDGANLTMSLRSLSQSLTISAFPSFMAMMPMTEVSLSQASFTTDAGGSTTTNVRIYVSPFPIYAHLHYNLLNFPLAISLAAGTNSFTGGVHYGIYSLTGNTMSMLTSFGFNLLASKNGATQTYRWWHGSGIDSTTNSSSLSSTADLSTRFQGLRHSPSGLVGNTGPLTITAGQYFIAAVVSKFSTGTGLTLHAAEVFNTSASQLKSFMETFKQTSTAVRFGRHWGFFSSSSVNSSWGYDMLPASFNTSIITSTGATSLHMWNFMLFFLLTTA